MLFYPIDVSVDRYKVLAINGSKKNYKKEIKTFLQTNNIDFSSHTQPIECYSKITALIIRLNQYFLATI